MSIQQWTLTVLYYIYKPR